ncbi:THAP domain-containing protein 8 isoform X3 [Eulemur rufifrons]|uniref:THAP domain-containing protein 8 isoform X3 n=1 Tax=Eulemur rufifrons TaxID=859984 RepID=UPI003741F018
MPKYCRAPNCSNTAGRLGADNRPVSFYKFPLKDGPRLQAWLRCMGREHWVPSCHQHLCSEHFTPSCFQWRWGVRYLRPDAVPSIFSRAPPAKSQRGTRSTKKRVVPLPPQEATPQTPGRAIPASGPVHLVVLGPAAGTPEAAATMLLPALPTSPTLAGPRPDVPAQQAGAGLGAALGALQRRVMAQLPGPEESQTFTIICGGPGIAVVLAQGPAPPTMDAKPELLDTQTPNA